MSGPRNEISETWEHVPGQLKYIPGPENKSELCPRTKGTSWTWLRIRTPGQNSIAHGGEKISPSTRGTPPHAGTRWACFRIRDNLAIYPWQDRAMAYSSMQSLTKSIFNYIYMYVEYICRVVRTIVVLTFFIMAIVISYPNSKIFYLSNGQLPLPPLSSLKIIPCYVDRRITDWHSGFQPPPPPPLSGCSWRHYRQL